MDIGLTTLSQMHKLHVKGTPRKGIVVNKTMLLCNLTNAVIKDVEEISPKVYINTRVLKHLYDSKPAEEFECILKSMSVIVKYPARIYANKNAKRGHFVFVKPIQNVEYMASVEHQPSDEMCIVVTCYRIRNPNYLNGYNLLWSWKGGTPSS